MRIVSKDSGLLLLGGILALFAAGVVLPHAARAAALPDGVAVIEGERGQIYCAFIDSEWVAGDLVKQGSDFRPYADRIRLLKLRVKKVTDTAKRKTLAAQLRRIRRLKRQEDELCAVLPPPSVDDPTVPAATVTPTPALTAPPTPLPVPTASPTATLTATAAATQTPTVSPTSTSTPTNTATPCFDMSGNTSCFGIPQPLVGNKNSGEAVFQTYCLACHTEQSRRGRFYSETVAAFLLPSMQAVGPLTDQEIADVTAYLNRLTP